MLEALGRAGMARVRAHGLSMRPFISDGDVAHIRKCDPSGLRIGDIAACRLGNTLVMHRLVWKRGNKILLKGDAMAGIDSGLTTDDVVGRVVAVETKQGLLFLETKNARAVNLLVMLYMIPVSVAMHARNRALGWLHRRRGTRRKPSPLLRRMAEWAPRAASKRLIVKKR
jgi:hypothetical protein